LFTKKDQGYIHDPGNLRKLNHSDFQREKYWGDKLFLGNMNERIWGRPDELNNLGVIWAGTSITVSLAFSLPT